MRTPSSFEAYYSKQAIMPAEELPLCFRALERPLPIDLRQSARAPLASRALARVMELLDPEEPPRMLAWVGGRAWQLTPRRGAQYHSLLHRQQQRGALHRQESASMLPSMLLAPEASHACLDMCAAPGSKSVQMLEMLELARAQSRGPAGEERLRGVLVCNDASLDRVISLNHRLQGVNTASPYTVVTSLEAQHWPVYIGIRK